MKRILVYAPDNYAAESSFRIRLMALAEPLARRGLELAFHVRPGNPWGRIKLARSARDFAGVILHRKMLDPYEARILRRNVPAGARIVMDIDDATMLHEKKLGRLARWRLDRRFAATAKILDATCAGNPYLAQMFQQRGVPTVMVPSVVDPARHAAKRHADDGTISLVWIGSRSTLKYLEESFPALRAAAAQVPRLRLVVICDVAPSDAPLPVDFVPWSEAGEAAALLRGDIGIAPTPENPWTLGKCGFKIVQYMAAGLPVIASPVGFNVDLVQPASGTGEEGGGPTGILPATDAEWPAAIARLAGDAALRRQFGTAGRQRIEQELCVEKMADRWAQVLAGA